MRVPRNSRRDRHHWLKNWRSRLAQPGALGRRDQAAFFTAPASDGVEGISRPTLRLLEGVADEYRLVERVRHTLQNFAGHPAIRYIDVEPTRQPPQVSMRIVRKTRGDQ